MSLLDAVTSRLIAVAARRWPADIRAEQAAEWHAELHAMASSSGANRVVRALSRLRFALSLAASPPVEDENGVPRGWRELLPAWGRMLWPALVLIGMGTASGHITSLVAVTSGLVGDLALGDTASFGRSPSTVWGKVAVGIAVCAVAAFALGWLGTLVGRRLALVPAPRTASRRLLSAVGAVALVAFGAALNIVWRGSAVRHDWFGFGMWTVVCAAVTVGVVFIARGGMRWTARVLGVTGGLILLDLIAVEIGLRWATGPQAMLPDELVNMSTAPLWLPISLGSHDPHLFNTPYPSAIATTGEIGWALSDPMTTYLLALVFIVGYTVRSARAAIPLAAPETATTAKPQAVPLRPRIAALACVPAALGTWALTVSFTGSRIEPRDDHPELFVRGFELRLAAILLAMLALAYALNGRGRPLVPALLGGVTLLIGDIVLSANAIPDATTFVLAGVLGAGVAMGVHRLTGELPPGGPGAARRGRALIALLACYAAPLGFLQMDSLDTSSHADPPAELRFITAVLAAGTIALGMTAAATARKRPPSKPAVLALVIVPAVLFAAVGFFGDVDGAAFLTGAGTLSLPMFAVAVTVIRWHRVRRPLLRVVLLAALFPPAMAAQALVVLVGGHLGGWAITRPLMEAAGTGIGHDGVPMFIGAMIIGLPAAIIGSRSPAARPKSMPARLGGLTTV